MSNHITSSINKSSSVDENSVLNESVTGINKSKVVKNCVCSREPKKKIFNHSVQQNSKKKAIFTGDTTLNGLHEKGLLKNCYIKVRNFPGASFKMEPVTYTSR